MNRIGGRCYTDMTTFGVPADLGAHWLHAHKGNEVAKFGMKHKDKFKIYKQPSAYAVYNGRSKDDSDTLWDVEEKIQKVYSGRQIDQPLIDVIPDKLKKKSGIDTNHAMLTATDFNNVSQYVDNVKCHVIDQNIDNVFCIEV